MITGFVHVMIKFRLHSHSLQILVVFFYGRKQEAKYSAMKSICRRFLINRTFRCMSDFVPELFSMCKQLLVLSERTVQQSKLRKVSSFDGGRQIIFTSPTIVRLEHALAKLDIVIWENVSTSGFSQFSLMWVQPQPQPPCKLRRKHSKHVVWTRYWWVQFTTLLSSMKSFMWRLGYAISHGLNSTLNLFSQGATSENYDYSITDFSRPLVFDTKIK